VNEGIGVCVRKFSGPRAKTAWRADAKKTAADHNLVTLSLRGTSTKSSPKNTSVRPRSTVTGDSVMPRAMIRAVAATAPAQFPAVRRIGKPARYSEVTPQASGTLI
jgi:hypothetical protein